MKHFMLTKEGAKEIAEVDLLRWRSQGSFMNAEGPVMVPSTLGPGEREAVEGLFSKKKNFVFWFTPDFRVSFSTKDGAVSTGGKFWAVRVEWRGVDPKGRASVSAAALNRKIPAGALSDVLHSIFVEMASKLVPADSAVENVGS